MAVGQVEDPRNHGAEPAFLDGLGGGKGHGPHGPAVEGAQKGNGPQPAGVMPGQLESGLHRLGPGIGQKDPFGALSGSDFA